MLELLFVVSREEAEDPRTGPLALPARLDDAEGSPFGFASRPARTESLEPPYPSDPYRPAYLPPPLAIDVARDVPTAEPLWFHLPSVMPDDERVHPVEHPNGARRVAGVTLTAPVPLGARSSAIAAALGIEVALGPHHLTLRLDGAGLAGRVVLPHERLPLTLEGLPSS